MVQLISHLLQDVSIFFQDLSAFGEDWMGWYKNGGAFKNQKFKFPPAL
jgi:hypothetical protein